MKVRQEIDAFDKSFNGWLQESLGIKDHKGTIHLSELLTIWSSSNDSGANTESKSQ